LFKQQQQKTPSILKDSWRKKREDISTNVRIKEDVSLSILKIPQKENKEILQTNLHIQNWDLRWNGHLLGRWN
jgi:hypothetical protein